MADKVTLVLIDGFWINPAQITFIQAVTRIGVDDCARINFTGNEGNYLELHDRRPSEVVTKLQVSAAVTLRYPEHGDE